MARHMLLRAVKLLMYSNSTSESNDIMKWHSAIFESLMDSGKLPRMPRVVGAGYHLYGTATEVRTLKQYICGLFTHN
jgi:hypothetical protein